MIYVSCNYKPFRPYHEQDVLDILSFLGRVVEYRLRLLSSDVRDSVVMPVRKWILKDCNVNKDIEIQGVAQITLSDTQIPLFDKVLWACAKPIG